MKPKKQERQTTKSKPILDVGLYLRGSDLNPEVVTSALGVDASKSRVRGEKSLTSTNQEITAKTGLWFLDISTESSSLRDRLAWLTQELGRFSGSLTSIPGVQEAEISVFIALADNDRGGGEYEFDLGPTDLASVSKLGAPITFAITHVPDRMGDKEKQTNGKGRRKTKNAKLSKNRGSKNRKKRTKQKR